MTGQKRERHLASELRCQQKQRVRLDLAAGAALVAQRLEYISSKRIAQSTAGRARGAVRTMITGPRTISALVSSQASSSRSSIRFTIRVAGLSVVRLRCSASTPARTSLSIVVPVRVMTRERFGLRPVSKQNAVVS